MPCGQTISAGDSIIFALAYKHPGTKSGYVKYGDSPRSLILKKLIPPLAKHFFDSPGNRSVKAVDPALSPSMS
jgi:hypothetical protein